MEQFVQAEHCTEVSVCLLMDQLNAISERDGMHTYCRLRNLVPAAEKCGCLPVLKGKVLGAGESCLPLKSRAWEESRLSWLLAGHCGHEFRRHRSLVSELPHCLSQPMVVCVDEPFCWRKNFSEIEEVLIWSRSRLGQCRACIAKYLCKLEAHDRS